VRKRCWLVNEDGTSNYTYDSTSQLTAADHDYQADESYTYDANGNRTMTGYSTGTNNRLLNDGTHTYIYDNEGNRTKKTVTATGEATEFEWDHRNRLVRVTHLDSIGDPIQTLDYVYDVLDQRIEKSDTPAIGPTYTQRYVYDGQHLALKFGANVLANRYLHGPVIDQILADERVSSLSSASDVLWPLVDNLGTVRDLAEHDSGTGDTVIVNHISYDAFGGSRAETNAAVDHLFGYTGRDWDADADLQYNRARWYDPAVGRWLSEDPIGFKAGDANLSRYVGNQATGKTDPSGLIEFQPIPEASTSGTTGGTPKSPTGNGLAINIFGSEENPKYKDYATNPEYDNYYRDAQRRVRHHTSSLPDQSVSDFCIRNSPIYPITWQEIVRLAMPGATITFAGDPEFILAIYKDISGLKIIDSYHQIENPRKFTYTFPFLGAPIGEGLMFTLQLGETWKYTGHTDPTRPTTAYPR